MLKRENFRRRFPGIHRSWRTRRIRNSSSLIFPAISTDETPDIEEINFSFPSYPFIITTNKNYSLCVIENYEDEIGIFFWDGKNKIFKNFKKKNLSREKLTGILGKTRYHELSESGEMVNDYNFVKLFLLPYEIQAIYRLRVKGDEFDYPYQKNPEYIPQGLIFAPSYVPIKNIKKAKPIKYKKEKAWILRRISRGVYHPDFYEKEYELEKGVYFLCRLV